MTKKQYKAIYSIKEIQPLLRGPDKTLIVFDIDYTLTHPNEPAFQFGNFKRNVELIQPVFLKLSPRERDLFANLMVFHISGNSPIEPDSSVQIEEMQELSYKVIALTASLTTPLNQESLIQKRIEDLKKSGFNFSKNLGDLPHKSYDQIPENFKSHPHYESGILFTNGENQKNYKGELLVYFLSSLSWKPQHIVFIDDRPLNLEVVQESLDSYDPSIDFTGLHFLGALNFPSREISKNEFSEKIESLVHEAQKLEEIL